MCFSAADVSSPHMRLCSVWASRGDLDGDALNLIISAYSVFDVVGSRSQRESHRIIWVHAAHWQLHMLQKLHMPFANQSIFWRPLESMRIRLRFTDQQCAGTGPVAERQMHVRPTAETCTL